MKDPEALAVKREAEEDWGRMLVKQNRRDIELFLVGTGQLDIRPTLKSRQKRLWWTGDSQND